MGVLDGDDFEQRSRTDVGYKRPPVEHQFKKGQKPPPRKKKEGRKISARDILWKVLQERRRVVVEGRPLWLTNAELIGRRAFLEAERGSSTLQRLLNDVLLSADPETKNELPEVIITRDGDELGDSFSAGTVYIQETPQDC